MQIGIIDLGISNVKSVQNMLHKIGINSTISSNHSELSSFEKIILPGVGSFDEGMRRIHVLGLKSFIQDYTQTRKNEILGICLGMQLLTKSSQEGQMEGLGLIDAEARRFQPLSDLPHLKVPNMGWKETVVQKPHRLTTGKEMWRFYFVHSYHVHCRDSQDVLMTANHGVTFTATFAKGNLYGMQFHPEKSHSHGLQILKNFCQAQDSIQ